MENHKENRADDAGASSRKHRSRYILLNTVSSYGRDIVETVAFLVLIPFIIHTLGTESFGLWSLIWSFLALFELADLGFGASVIKYVADARGRNDMERLKKIVCTLFWIYVCLGAVVMLGVAASLLFFNRLFQIPPDQAPMAQAVLLILGVRASLYLPLGLFRGVLVGYQKMTVANVYKMVASLLYFVAALFFLTLFPDIRVLATVNMVAGVLPMLAMMIHTKRMNPDLSIHPRHFERALVRELSSFSIYFSFTQVARLIATRADAMIIKLFLPLEMVGIYSVGMRLTDKASLFCSHLARALSPVFAELHGADDKSTVRAAYRMGSKLTIAFATPLLLGLALLAHPLIIAWTGPEFRLAVPVCQWLAAAAIVSIVHLNSVNLLGMVGHQRYAALSLIALQALNLVLSVILIQRLGIVGVAMATFIAYVSLYVGLIQRHASKVSESSLWDYYIGALWPSVIPALIMSAGLIALLRYWTPTNLVEVAILEMICIAIFWLGFWIVGFTPSERSYFKDKVFNRLLRRTSTGRAVKVTMSEEK